MKSKNKKPRPEARIVFALVIASVLGVTAAILIINKMNSGKNPEKEPETYIMDDGIPHYENVPTNAFDENSFTLNENGRMIYTGDNVKYTTGIDVSSHQGDIDWEKVKNDDIDFAIIRIGFRGYGPSGEIYDDELAENNIKNAKKAGLKVGVYFYSQAITPDEAAEEALYVANKLKETGEEIEYPVFFDWENEEGKGMRTDGMAGKTITECALSFLDKIESEGYIPGVYFNLSYGYKRYNLDKIKDYWFWYAQYEKPSPEFYYSYDVWQYSCTAKVDGVDSDVDLNIHIESN